MCSPTMITFVALGLYIAIQCITSAASREEASMSGSHYLDRDKGILLYEKGVVYVYDTTIYIPIILSIPTELDQSLTSMFEEDSCGILDFLEHKMRKCVKEVEMKLPIMTPILKKPNLRDMILKQGKLSVDHKIDDQTIIDVGKRRRIQKIKIRDYDIASRKRVRRVAWMMVGLWATVASLGLLATANRADVEISRNRLGMLESNQRLIDDVVRKNRETINLIVDNQDKIIFMVNNITEKINEITDDYNCHKERFEYYADLASTWLNIVPNSFIRAVNGAISGKLTIDLLPGSKLGEVVQYYSEFHETIFMRNPTLLYESAQVKIVKLSSNPPVLEVLMSVPRILATQYGNKYTLVGCPIPLHNKWFQLDGVKEYYKSIEKDTWWKSDSCQTTGGISLCDIRGFIPATDPCLNIGSDGNITGCELHLSKPGDKNSILRTEGGLLVCQSQDVVISSRDAFGITHSRTVNVKGPTFFSSVDGDAIMINDLHYTLHENAAPIIIKEKYTLHPLYNDSSFISKIDPSSHIDHIKKLDEIPRLQTYHYTITGSVIGTIVVIIILSLVFWYIVKKINRKHITRYGYLMGLLSQDGVMRQMEEGNNTKNTETPTISGGLETQADSSTELIPIKQDKN